MTEPTKEEIEANEMRRMANTKPEDWNWAGMRPLSQAELEARQFQRAGAMIIRKSSQANP
jgi:hypothetical protein